jgi:hypothetical protein
LTQFLQTEADLALRGLLPDILKELEEKYFPGTSLEINLSNKLANYKSNLQTFISNELVRKLVENLGYSAHTEIRDGQIVLIIS